MKQTWKQMLALALVLAMMAAWLPTMPAGAVGTGLEHGIQTETFAYVNPEYADFLTVEDLLWADDTQATPAADTTVYHATTQAAGEALREGLKARTTEIPVGILYQGEWTDSTAQTLANEMMAAAMEHTGVPTEGDYISKQYKGYTGGVSRSYDGTTYSAVFTFTVTYFTTAEQEAQVDEKLEEVFVQLNVSQASDYEKVCAVYDYLCENITYDYENLNDKDYLLKHSAYAGLIDGTCVCQGYAVLFYRMALELGVDARYISGVGNGGAHGWNIVELGELYYNLDSTWDAGRSEYGYFLKAPANFTDHVRDAEYDTAAFQAAYPMADSDYDPTQVPTEPETEPTDPIEPETEPTDPTEPETEPTATISGTVTSYGTGMGVVTVELLDGTGAVAATVQADEDGAYTLATVAPGAYTIQFRKQNHVTRSYEITVADADLVQNGKIFLLGDVNGDGRVNVGDCSILLAHVKGVSEITDEYLRQCGNLNGDRLVNVGDCSILLAHVKGVQPLW